MPFPRKLLNENEEIVLDLRPHWLFMALSSGVFLVVILMGLALLGWNSGRGWFETGSNYVVGAGFLFCAAWFGLTYARWANTHFVLTTDRIINREGVIAKRGTDIPLDRVNTVLFNQGPLERLVGAGDLTVESASETGANEFRNVRRPNIVQKEIYTQIEANENRKYDRMRGPGPAGGSADQTTPQPVAQTIPDQIDQLSELHQRGVLSDAEFARKKAELLDRM